MNCAAPRCNYSCTVRPHCSTSITEVARLLRVQAQPNPLCCMQSPYIQVLNSNLALSRQLHTSKDMDAICTEECCTVASASLQMLLPQLNDGGRSMQANDYLQ